MELELVIQWIMNGLMGFYGGLYGLMGLILFVI